MLEDPIGESCDLGITPFGGGLAQNWWDGLFLGLSGWSELRSALFFGVESCTERAFRER